MDLRFNYLSSAWLQAFNIINLFNKFNGIRHFKQFSYYLTILFNIILVVKKLSALIPTNRCALYLRIIYII